MVCDFMGAVMSKSDRKDVNVEAVRKNREDEEQARLKKQAIYNQELEESMAKIRALSDQLEGMIKNKKELPEDAKKVAENLKREYEKWKKNMPELLEKNHEAAAAGIMAKAGRILQSFFELFKTSQSEVKNSEIKASEVKVEVMNAPVSKTGVFRERIIEDPVDIVKASTPEPKVEKVEIVKPIQSTYSHIPDHAVPFEENLDEKHNSRQENVEKQCAIPKEDIRDEFLAQYIGLLETIHSERRKETKAESETLDELEKFLGKDRIKQEVHDVELISRRKANLDSADRKKDEKNEKDYGLSPTRRGPGRYT